MNMRIFKYGSPFLIYFGAIQSFFSTGWVVFIPLFYSWIFIPLLELFLKPDETNLSTAEEELIKNDKFYDALLYAIVPLQYLALGAFLYSITYQHQSWIDIAAKTSVMGLLCGTLGINVGHELGHRKGRVEQFLAKALLLTSQYMHFFIEHNKGHHKHVGTPNDPSTARFGEVVYAFFFRSIILSYFSAWGIAATDTKKKGKPAFSWNNEMLCFQVVQLVFIGAIVYFFGWFTTLLYLLAALNGILLLECVNYIEHYGLQRNEIADGKYERAMPEHSWNSNHVLGRVMLFELSRHSDHHYLASRKYQVLRHHDNSPQMPTGYPGMMILSLIPPAWFYIMNKRVAELQQQTPVSSGNSVAIKRSAVIN